MAEATRQLSSALAHLHSLEVAHGDIKPANVLLVNINAPNAAAALANASAIASGAPAADDGGGGGATTITGGARTAAAPSAAPPAGGEQGKLLHLKLCDFGFACICGDRRLKSYCGTPACARRPSSR